MGKSYSKLTPRIVNTFFTLALQQYFRTHPEYPWSPYDNKTLIDITPDYIEDDDMEKGLPLIIVQNGPSSIEPAGVGTGMYSTGSRAVMLDNIVTHKDGVWDTKLQFTINSQTQIQVIATSKDDVDELAFDIAMFMLMLKYSVANILQLQFVGSPQQSPAQQMTQVGWQGKYMSSIIVPYTYTIARQWMPIDFGPVLTAIETAMTPVNKGTTPKPGDTDLKGNPINIGGVGATNTGGQNGNWGGTGGVSPDPVADGIDDNCVDLRFRVSADDASGYQPGVPEPQGI